MREENARSPRRGAILTSLGLALGLASALAYPSRAVLAAPPRALIARTVLLNESGRLRVVSKHGFTLNERGSASGTIKGTIYVHLTVVSTSRVRVEVSIYPSGGSISGSGTASYHMAPTAANFFGSLSIARGSGSYEHAHGPALSFSGTIQRSNDAVTVRVSGSFSD